MASKWFIVLCCSILLLFSSCLSTNPDAENEQFLTNGTGDTLIIGVSTSFPYDSPRYFRQIIELYPYENYRIGGSLNKVSVADMIRLWSYDDKRDTIEVYKTVCETCGGEPIYDRGGNQTLFMGNVCYAKWGGPIVALHDSVHSFYNINSWVITTKGKKNRLTVATFTIREEDLQQID